MQHGYDFLLFPINNIMTCITFLRIIVLLVGNGGPIKAQEDAIAPPLTQKTIVGASNCAFAQLVVVHSCTVHILPYFHFQHSSIYLSLQCK